MSMDNSKSGCALLIYLGWFLKNYEKLHCCRPMGVWEPGHILKSTLRKVELILNKTHGLTHFICDYLLE